MPSQVCEKHKLRYDPETQSGCVVCRREAAATSGAPATAAGSAAGSGASPEAPADLGRPLAVAAAIWLISALVLFTAHQRFAETFVGDPAGEEADLGFGASAEPTLDPAVDPNSPQPSLGPQTDAVLEELAAQQAEAERRAATRSREVEAQVEALEELPGDEASDPEGD